MKVVLLENVEHLGIVGDVKEVAAGYARNYLLPKKLAVKNSDSQAKILLKNIGQKRNRVKTEIKKLEKAAKNTKARKSNSKLKQVKKENCLLLLIKRKLPIS